MMEQYFTDIEKGALKIDKKKVWNNNVYNDIDLLVKQCYN